MHIESKKVVKFVTVSVLVLICGKLAMVAVRLVTGRSPLDAAERLTSTASWELRAPAPYAWASDRQVFHFTRDRAHTPAKAAFYDVAVQKDTRCPVLDDSTMSAEVLFNPHEKRMIRQDFGSFAAAETDLSGVMIAANNPVETEPSTIETTAAINGAGSGPRGRTTYGSYGLPSAGVQTLRPSYQTTFNAPGVVYTPDGRYWYSGTALGTISAISVHESGTTAVMNLTVGTGVFAKAIVGTTPTGGLLLCGDSNTWIPNFGARTISLTEIQPGTTAQLVRTMVLKVPCLESRIQMNEYLRHGADSHSTFQVSPDGKRILWHFFGDTVHFTRIKQQQSFWPIQTTFGQIHDLWVSDLDGKNLDYLGRITDESVRIGKNWTERKFQADARWLPNSKDISFIYNRALWKLPLP